MFTLRDNSWKRGLPIKTEVFDKDGNVISESTSEYEFSSLATHPDQHYEVNTLSLIDRTASYNPIANLYGSCNEGFYYTNNAQRFMIGHHYGKEVAGSIFLKKTSTTNYDQDLSGNSITNSTEYEYSDKYLFPVRVIQNENNGDKTISESKYVLDYDLDQTFTQQEATTLRDMRDKHIISPVIEQTVWKQKAGDSKRLLGASLNTFQIHQTNILENLYVTQSANYRNYFSLVPLATYSFEPTNTWQPISESNFIPSSITIEGLKWDERYYKKRVTYEGVDRFGNITSAKELYGTPSATIFGYNGLFPVASVSGASHRQVAYEGFESYGEENPYPNLVTDEVFRGKYSSTGFRGDYIEGLPLARRYLIYPNPFEPIPKGDYIFSFWAKGNGRITINSSYSDSYNVDFSGSDNEWTYYERAIFINNNQLPTSSNQNFITYVIVGDNSNTSYSNTRIDEIRLHPKGSFMTTSTYKPLVGVTHTTDAEQRTSSYYYDPLRRVESVRDHKNNLIKSYEYKYMSEDAESNPLFSISTTPTPESLINTSVSVNVNQTELNRCLSSTSNYNHKWNFGDGSPLEIRNNSRLDSISHTYTQAGTYVITLSVEVVAGYWVDAHTSIRIIDPTAPPDLTNELTATLNGTVDPNNSLCYDLVATPNGGTAPFTYQWFSGEGTSNPTQTTAQLNHCYTSFGNFTPRVIITDATGATANATFDLTVSNPIEPLTSTIISNDSFCKGSCAYFEANVTGGTPDYTYLWEVINPFTNRNINLGTNSSLSFQIPNPTPANQYTIYLTVTDSEGREVTTSKTVTVLDDNACSSSLGGFMITDRRGQPINPADISLGDNAIFTSPLIGQGYNYEWKVEKDGVGITTENSTNPSFYVSFATQGNYTITCNVSQIMFIGGLRGGNPRPFSVGSNTVQINICDALNLPRF